MSSPLYRGALTAATGNSGPVRVRAQSLPNRGVMGCGLRKMKPTSEDSSPGKIYSTLKRPQVETKVGVAYTYRYLDFLIGRDGGTSTLRLSSVRELPGQLQELYQQGFVLAAVHPFIHPCGPESNGPQHQLYRAILVRISDGAERSQPLGAPHKLQLEECLSAEQVPTPELIQGYVKKIQDAADQGVMFVGFVQEPYGAPCTRIGAPDTPSLSLHSSPSSVFGSLGSCSPSNPSSPVNSAEPGARVQTAEEGREETPCRAEDGAPGGERSPTGNTGNIWSRSAGVESSQDKASPAASPASEADVEHSRELTEADSPCHNNNKGRETKERQRYRVRRGAGAELLAFYNHPPVRQGQVKYYTVKVPLRVQNCDEGVKGVEANWLDHMTQHFNNGASLVDGYFYLGTGNDSLSKSVESVFIFQEAGEGEDGAPPMYDAIVVEQWTVIDGLQVKADYVPLLQSLATYGWRLTCVLPTPVIKTNSDGSLATKQIVFLQRPVLGRKRRESKKLIFKARSKSNKNCVKDTAKNKKKKNKTDKDADDPKILDDREKAEKDDKKSSDERVNSADVESARENETSEEREVRCAKERKIDGGVEISIVTVSEKDGGPETKDKAAEEATLDEERSEENGEPVEVQDVAEAVAESETKDREDEGAAEAAVESGIETDE
ncbi:raftlin-like isoform X2 [Betta splendens]|uniref:Raftlin-like isoform X2 n=1 Tax=Betta splendens TaxID=158456 RepID=A0A9W2XCG0_BETSP|nr:raftlin-like isoform X2 [Betta splendens]